MSRTRPVRAAPPTPVHFGSLIDRGLVGAFVALVAARPIVVGDDPGRLRLTSGAGPLSFNLCVFGLFTFFAVRRAFVGDWRFARRDMVPLLLAVVGLWAFVSSLMGDRYARPGQFIAWEWLAIAAATFLAGRISVANSRGLVNAIVASAVSVAALACYQAVTSRLGLPTTEVYARDRPATLVGDDEFYPELNAPPTTAGQVRGTFDRPETLAAFLLLTLPVAASFAWAGWSAGGRMRSASLLFGLMTLVLIVAAMSVSLGGEDRWLADWHMIANHPLWGVGPGNFSRQAADGGLAPGSAWLGLGATAGLASVALLVVVLIGVFVAASRTRREPSIAPGASPRGWEFYIGGAAGLLLGFLWSLGDLPAEAAPAEILRPGAAAIGRAVFWFGSYALIEKLRLSGRTIADALLVGVGLVAAYGFVADSPGLPTILFPFWVGVALALNFLLPMKPAAGGVWSRPFAVAGAVAGAGLTLAFLVTAAVPGWGTASAIRAARAASRFYPDRHRQIDLARSRPERAKALTEARNYLAGRIVNPLRAAVTSDPHNAALWLELAHWLRPLWKYQLVADPTDAARIARETLKSAATAAKLDAPNLAGERSLFEALILFRAESSAVQAERMAALTTRVERIAAREPPSEVPLRLRLVNALLDGGKADEIVPELVRLLRLNREADQPHGRLTEMQRAELIEKAKKVLKTPPPELLEEWTR